MNEIPTSTCCTCGFSWPTGSNGHHHCSEHLAAALTAVTAQRDAAWATIAAIKKDFVDDESFGKVVDTLFAEPLIEAERKLAACRTALEPITHDMGASQNVHNLCAETLKQITP